MGVAEILMKIRFLLFLAISTSLLRWRGTVAQMNVILSCYNQSCVFSGLDPCVEYTMLGSALTRSIELQFLGNLTSCDELEAGAAVMVRVNTSKKYLLCSRDDVRQARDLKPCWCSLFLCQVWEVQTESNYSDQGLPLLVTTQQLSNGETLTWTLPDSSQLYVQSDRACMKEGVQLCFIE